VSGFFGEDSAGLVATWVAALVTIVVLGGMLGERRLFGWTQHLLAGLVTGFLALLALTEVIGPRLVEPLALDAGGRLELWLGLALVGTAAGAPWLPRTVASVPLAIVIGALAAFALGGAVIGTLLPQLAAVVLVPGEGAAATVARGAMAVVSTLVLFGFIHGTPRGRIGTSAATLGRWLLLVGIGGWLGYLLFSRLLLLLDRIGFLLGDWLGIGR
jgi:hypothetical protein